MFYRVVSLHNFSVLSSFFRQRDVFSDQCVDTIDSRLAQKLEVSRRFLTLSLCQCFKFVSMYSSKKQYKSWFLVIFHFLMFSLCNLTRKILFVLILKGCVICKHSFSSAVSSSAKQNKKNREKIKIQNLENKKICLLLK